MLIYILIFFLVSSIIAILILKEIYSLNGKKNKRRVCLVKADKNLVDAEWRYFTLTQRKLFWYIAKRMQELGFTRDSLYIQDVLTPIKTKVLMLDTGEVKRRNFKDLSFKHRIRKPIQRNKHNTRSSARSSKKYQKTTLTFKDKERKKRNLLQCNSKSRFFGRWKKH